MTPRVLIIDDDLVMLELLKLGLARDQLHVATAANGADGLRQFYEQPPDVVLLDLLMPGMNGWEVYQSIRRASDVPVIFLSALDQAEQIIAGLEGGAADYVAKPFNMRVLQARVKAVLRRVRLGATETEPLRYDDGYLAIDLNQRQVAVCGTATRLSAKEFELLSYLVQHAGRVLTFAQILTQVWGDQHWDNKVYVHAYIRQLRQKLAPNPTEPS